MYSNKWSFFPCRLHTTKEIIFFLENIANLKNVIYRNPPALISLIFGDAYHPAVIEAFQKFIINYKHNISRIYTDLILEICSRKIYYFNDIPLNHYYTKNRPSIILGYNLREKILTDNEIEQDLIYIKQLSKKIHPNAKINIIPHLNLKLESTHQYIPKRNGLVNLLGNLCIKLNLKFHDIGKYIEREISPNAFLEDYMADGSHYSFNGGLVKKFLETQIFSE